METEKIKSIVYAVGMTTVAAIALFCTVKFAMLVHKTEKLVHKTEKFVDSIIETGNDVKEITGEIKKEYKQLSDINNNDDKTDKNETDKGTSGPDKNSKAPVVRGIVSDFAATVKNVKSMSEDGAIITSEVKNFLLEEIPDKKGDPKPNTTVTPDKQESEPKTRIVQFKEDLAIIHETLPKIQEVTERANRTVKSFGFDRRSNAEVAADEAKKAAEKVASKGEPGNYRKIWNYLMEKDDGTRFDDSGIFKRVSDYLWPKSADTRNDGAEADAAQETDNANDQNIVEIGSTPDADNETVKNDNDNPTDNNQQAAESNDGDNSDSVKNEKLMCGIQ